MMKHEFIELGPLSPLHGLLPKVDEQPVVT